MYSTFAGSLFKALILSSLLRSATAQTYSTCNPLLQSGCPADPALGKSVAIDFTSGPSSEFTASGNPTYDSNGAAFTISKSGDAPAITSKWYIMFGHVDFVIKAAPGTGIVSAAILQSDCLDEIDWEWLGGDNTQAQSNYFGKGMTTTGYNRGAFHGADDNHDTFHTYSIDWTADQIVWSIDGTTVRAMTQAQAESGQYPQTPMYVKLGAWAGGDSSNPQGTIQWAGGLTDYSAGPFTMYVKSVHVTDYSTGSQYSYSGTSGTWESIVSNGGKINGKGNGAPVSTAEAPAVTSHVSDSAPLAFGNNDNAHSVTATRTGWPWSGTATATAVTLSQSPSLSSVQASLSVSESASLEVLTSYDGQGSPTFVTINPAAQTTPKSYDSQGFQVTSSQSPTSAASSANTEMATPSSASVSGTVSTPPTQPTSVTEGQTRSEDSGIATRQSTSILSSSGVATGTTDVFSANPPDTPSTMTANSIAAPGSKGEPSLTGTYGYLSDIATTASVGFSVTLASMTSGSADSTLQVSATTSVTDVAPTNSPSVPEGSFTSSFGTSTTQTRSTTNISAVPSEHRTTLRTSSSLSRTQPQSALSTPTATPPAVNYGTSGHDCRLLQAGLGVVVGLLLV